MILNNFFNLFKKNDWTLIVSMLLLIFFGIAAIYSVALGQGKGEFANFQKQLIWLVIGLVVFLAVANFDYHHWRSLGWFFYFLSIFFLVLVLTPLGSTIRGTRGWFDWGLISFQPVEITKIFLIIILAAICSKWAKSNNKTAQMIWLIGVVTLPLFLVLLQPDFGSAMMLLSLWFGAFALTSKKKWPVAAVILAVVAVLVFSWFFVFKDYQKQRVKTFIDPSLDPQGSGYNVRQSIIAVGGGRLMGRGLGFGSQSQLKFIPESQTDFIFAVIAEELGFVGVSLMIGFFFLVFYRIYYIASRAPDDFGMFLCLFASFLIFIQVFINIGMCIGLLPVTGISLPFVSYGGSFLVSMMFLMGIVLNVYKFGVISRRY